MKYLRIPYIKTSSHVKSLVLFTVSNVLYTLDREHDLRRTEAARRGGPLAQFALREYYLG